MKKPLVSICCITYNHKNYIRDAVKGFLMQKTDFPIEIIIYDDASTDGTAEIIKEYAKKYEDLIIPIFQTENQYSKGVKIFSSYVFPITRGRYVALCEGDDYWIDPLKLQKQHDYMENNVNCSLTTHAAIVVNNHVPTNKIIRTFNQNKNIVNNKLQSLGGSSTPTASFFFRKKFIKNFPQWFLEAPIGDVPLFLFLLEKGYVYYLNEVMSAYRTNMKESWTSHLKLNESKQIYLHEGLIDMWDGFNEWTNFKYQDEVAKQQLVSKCKLLRFEAFSERIKFLFSNKNLIDDLSFKEKIKCYLSCFVPYLIRAIFYINSRIKLNSINI